MKKLLYLYLLGFILTGCVTEEKSTQYDDLTYGQNTEGEQLTFGLGSSYKEVKAILGPPNSLQPETEEKYEVWTYDFGDSTTSVYFEAGVVKSWDNVPQKLLQ